MTCDELLAGEGAGSVWGVLGFLSVIGTEAVETVGVDISEVLPIITYRRSYVKAC